MAEVLLTPTNKLRALDPNKKNFVLLSFGSYCPIHNNHISMLVTAKRFMEDKGYNIVGTYISVSSDNQNQKKLKGDWLPFQHRTAMCELVTSEFDWIMVDKYSGTHGLMCRDGKKHLETFLHEYYKTKDVTLLSVIGADGAMAIRSKNIFKAGMLIVVNRKLPNSLDQWVSRPHVAPYIEKTVFIVYQEGWEKCEHSSTKVRQALKKGESISEMMPPYVIKYLEQHNINWKEPKPFEIKKNNSHSIVKGRQPKRKQKNFEEELQ